MAAPDRTAEILLVESDPEAAECLRAAFQELDPACSVRILRTGREALAFCRRQRTAGDMPRANLVLLDLGLQDTPGLEVLEAFKQDDALRRIPIVVLSARSDAAEISRAYQLGANSFIPKPADAAGCLRLAQGVEEFWLTIVMLPES